MIEKSKKKIKICQVVSVDLSLRFLLFDFMKYLQKEGFELQAVSSDGKWIWEIRDAGIQIKTISITRKLFTPISDIIALFQLFLFFKKERFDIVHTHTPKATFLGQLAAFFAGVSIRITTIHGLYFQENSSWQKKMLFVPIERIVAKIVHKAFSVNREDVELLLKWKIYTKEKITYIGGGIDLSKFNPERFSQKFIMQKKRSIGIPQKAKVIGIVARLVKEKGFLPLFSAFSSVLEQFPDAILLVVGPKEPEKRDSLDLNVVDEYGIKDKVMFLGERTDVIELYALMDIFVLPSYREGLGLSILEASAMGKPIVSSDIRGCRETVDDKKTGLLVPSNNPAELAKALIYILLHPEVAKNMGKAGRKKVEKEFNERTLFDRIKKEYYLLIEKNI